VYYVHGKPIVHDKKNREKLPPLEKMYNDEFIDQLDEFIPHLKK